MTKVLDFLVENYIYVAGVSGFLIIALIGFLFKSKKKNKENDLVLKEEVNVVEEKTKVENIVQPIKNIESNINNGFMNRPVQPMENVNNSESIEHKDNDVSISKTNEPIGIQNNIESMYNVEPALETFKVKLDNQTNSEPLSDISFDDIPRDSNNSDMFNINDTIVLDREKLDEEVDIIDFSNLNNFESKEDLPKPQDDNTNL